MDVLKPYRLEPEHVPEENKASNDNSDASERLRGLNWSTAFVVNSEELQESEPVVLNSPIRKTGLRNLFHVLWYFFSFNMHAIRHHLRIYVIKTSSEDSFGIQPCQNLTAPLCWEIYMSELIVIQHSRTHNVPQERNTSQLCDLYFMTCTSAKSSRKIQEFVL